MQEAESLSFPASNRIRNYALIASLALLCIDYISGPHVRVPILFSFPVVLAGWFGLLRTSMLLAFGMPLVRLTIEVTAWRGTSHFPEVFANTATFVGALAGLAYLAHRAGMAQRLQKRVKILEGILPICGFCKRIRDKDEHWQPIEKYVSDRSDAAFSHGLCPDCTKKHYPEYLDD